MQQKLYALKTFSKILIDFFIFVLLSRESDEGAKHRTNPGSRRNCPCFRIFRLHFASDKITAC